MSNQWLTVSKGGLANIVARRKSFLVNELIQNAWDENTTDVSVILEPEGRYYRLSVSDDNPSGFADLSHAYTLFADSVKKGDPEKRGRFNLGEKLVLSLCVDAEISTTTGTIIFNEDGTRKKSRKKRVTGSRFTGRLRLVKAEYEEVCKSAKMLIPPEGIVTTFNNVPVEHRYEIAVFKATLPTEIAGDDGKLKKTKRQTMVKVYQPKEGEPASLFEMGIPVVPTGDRYHIDIQQKIPLNMNRDNVRPSYLRDIRTLVLNNTYELLDKESSTEAWVNAATSTEKCSDKAINKVMDLRFGEKRVSYDASDTEASKKAVSKGFVVLTGGSLNKQQWQQAKRAGAIKPAGQVMPTPKPYDGKDPINTIEPEDWTPAMRKVVAYAERLASYLLNREIDVRIVNNPRVFWEATYGASSGLTLNLGKLGRRWFNNLHIAEITELLIHEYAHERESDHLSEGYHNELCRLGVKSTLLALTKPEIFNVND